MIPGRLVALLLLLVMGCASSPAPKPRHELQPPQRHGWRQGRDGLSASMRRISERVERGGLSAGRLTFRGFLSAGARSTRAVELPAHTCATLIAIASPGVHDMDAAIYSPEGELLAADSQPDAHPTIQLCTGPRARRLYYVLHVYEGAGAFLMVPFVGDHDALEETTRMLGTRPAIARLGPEETGAVDRVEALRDGLRRRGFEPHEAPLRIAMAHDQHVRSTLRVEPGACYTVAGFALGALGDVALRVLDDEGVVVSRDTLTRGDAAAQFCADRRGLFATELHATRGEGQALLSVFRADTATIGGEHGLWLGERPLRAASPISLAEARAAVTTRADEDGFRNPRSLFEGHLASGEVVRTTVQVPAHRCARIHAVGGKGIRVLRLAVYDEQGDELMRGEGDAQTSYVHVCATRARELSLSVHARGGGGKVALVSHVRRIGSVRPEAGDDRVKAHFLQALRRARDAGYHVHGAFEDGPQLLVLDQGQPRDVIFGAEAARCVRAYALSEQGRLETILRVDDELVASEVAPEHVRYCATTEEPLDVVTVALDTKAARAWLMVLVK
ncbi:MAG: hypothetical protein PVI30_11205 [Myxococcales bacterium]|jgi:hypothetical protein